MTTLTVTFLVIAILAVALAAWAVYRMQATKRLRSRFGPEYDYLVEREGDRTRAEAELAHREKRVSKFKIRELTKKERERFVQVWRKQQTLFVEGPQNAVAEADALITEVMTLRGYPTTTFEAQVADISVDHARVAENYREAHRIAELGRQATTEDLRRAMICDRALFEELIGSRVLKFEKEEVQH